MLRGRGKNVIADRFSITICSWVNNDNLTGIKYSDDTKRPKSLRSHEAIIFRQRISQNIRKFTGKIADRKD